MRILTQDNAIAELSLSADAFAPLIEQEPQAPTDPKATLRESRKPPKEGRCRHCGLTKPCNRLLLCYPCWVKSVLADRFGWKEGVEHPESCDCDIPGAHGGDQRA